jgi:hypothetical protein
MDVTDRWVLVRAKVLDDHLDLVERAMVHLDSIQPNDPLQACLRGTSAELRVHSLLEPV